MSLPEIPPALARALDARGYVDLTPVQLAVMQPDANGRDLLVSAKTGSGKTVAYGLAFSRELLMLERPPVEDQPGLEDPIGLENKRGGEAKLGPAGDPLALVIAPTRELALQVQRELEWLYGPAGGRVVSCVGGMDPRREQRSLAAGAHIVVGTPGRLRDHLERGQLELKGLRVVVLDEADEMLDLGFREELEAILEAAPEDRRTLLFSATLPKPIITLARQHQKDALRISVAGGEQGHSEIEYRAIRIAPSDVEHAVVNLLRYFEAGAALVFCSTREAVRRLHANLVERGFSVVALSGELTQNERSHALQALRDRRARVCVATDVAARGLDIPDLELVVHAELPHDAQALQHRSGRTGRAGRKGLAAVLVTHPRRRRAEALFRSAGIEPDWMGPPTAEDIRVKDQDRLISGLAPVGEPAEEDLLVARALLEGREPEAVVASLVRSNRAQSPAAEDLVDQEPEMPSRPAPRPGFEDTQWFSIDIGRNKNADPRWLLPLICRRGNVTKRDIGAIRVFERATRFEIVRPLADRFFAAAQRDADEPVTIQRVDDPDLPPNREGRGYRQKPHQGAHPPKRQIESRRDYAAGEPAIGGGEGLERRATDARSERPKKTYGAPRPKPEPPKAQRTPLHTSKRQAAKIRSPKMRGGKPPRVQG